MQSTLLPYTCYFLKPPHMFWLIRMPNNHCTMSESFSWCPAPSQVLPFARWDTSSDRISFYWCFKCQAKTGNVRIPLAGQTVLGYSEFTYCKHEGCVCVGGGSLDATNRRATLECCTAWRKRVEIRRLEKKRVLENNHIKVSLQFPF